MRKLEMRNEGDQVLCPRPLGASAANKLESLNNKKKKLQCEVVLNSHNPLTFRLFSSTIHFPETNDIWQEGHECRYTSITC